MALQKDKWEVARNAMVGHLGRDRAGLDLA